MCCAVLCRCADAMEHVLCARRTKGLFGMEAGERALVRLLESWVFVWDFCWGCGVLGGGGKTRWGGWGDGSWGMVVDVRRDGAISSRGHGHILCRQCLSFFSFFRGRIFSSFPLLHYFEVGWR